MEIQDKSRNLFFSLINVCEKEVNGIEALLSWIFFFFSLFLYILFLFLFFSFDNLLKDI